MSHFTLGVILPIAYEETETDYLNRMLSPFSESLEVEPYEVECWCVGLQAKNYANNKANILVGSLKKLELAEMRHEWFETRDNYLPYGPGYGEPSQDCDECNGTGKRTSTYNPNSKWDWWKVGGRWARHLPNGRTDIQCQALLDDKRSRAPIAPDPSDSFYKFDLPDYQDALERYESVDADLRDMYVPFAVLTPDGIWHQEGDMGWFGMVANERHLQDWMAEVREIYTEYAQHTLVLIDCHI